MKGKTAADLAQWGQRAWDLCGDRLSLWACSVPLPDPKVRAWLLVLDSNAVPGYLYDISCIISDFWDVVKFWLP